MTISAMQKALVLASCAVATLLPAEAEAQVRKPDGVTPPPSVERPRLDSGGNPRTCRQAMVRSSGIGAVVGAASILLLLVLLSGGSSERNADLIPIALVGAGAGAGIGALVQLAFKPCGRFAD